MLQYYNKRALLEKGAADFNAIFAGFNLDNVFQPKAIEQIVVKTTDTEGTITMLVPGHDSSTLAISVVDGSLTVCSGTGDKVPAGAQEVSKTWKFSPDLYDETAITAECKNGILTIVIPRKKPEEKKVNRIEIK